MKDIHSLLQELRRPRLLIRAARYGVDDYQREQHLKRHLGYGSLPRSASALMQLIEKEGTMNEERRCGNAGYSIVQHVYILIAIMGEARLLRSSPTFAGAEIT